MTYLTLLAILFGLLVLWKLYKNVIQPYFLYKGYIKQFKQKGYKFYAGKFIPFASEVMFVALNDEKNHDDSFYSAKHFGPEYDFSMANLGSRILIFLNDPKLIKQLYTKDVSGEYKKERQTIRGLSRVIHDAITFSEGDQWKKKRKYATIFLNYDYLNQQVPVIGGIIDRKIKEFSKGQQTFSVNLLELCESITSTTIIELFFGGGHTKIENLLIENKKIGTYMRQIIELMGEQFFDPLSLLFGMGIFELGLKKRDREVNKRLRLFKAAAKQFVKERLEEIKAGKSIKEDYISKIYELASEEEKKADFITDLVHDFNALFAAGTDTTSHSAIMMIYLCILHPKVLEKLLAEINEFVKNDEDITHETLKKMKYLDYVFYESMRYYQPANGIFFREAQFDHNLGEFQISKGTLLTISSFSNHYNPQYYDDPTSFRPERWMKEDGSTVVAKPYTFLTFSSGPRSCVGKTLAQIEMKLMAIKFFKNYQLSISDKKLIMKMKNFSYQPQPIQTTFKKKN